VRPQSAGGGHTALSRGHAQPLSPDTSPGREAGAGGRSQEAGGERPEPGDQGARGRRREAG